MKNTTVLVAVLALVLAAVLAMILAAVLALVLAAVLAVAVVPPIPKKKQETVVIDHKINTIYEHYLLYTFSCKIDVNI